jgi:outer membrane biosynthesis protein TonB
MRFGLPISLIIHGGVIAVGVMVLPAPKLAVVNTPEIVPVELVILAKETNIKAQAAKPKLRKEEPAPMVTEPEVLPEPEPEPEPAPLPKAKPKPKSVKKDVAPKPKTKPKKKTPRPKKKPKPKAPTFDLARLENKLAKQDKDNPVSDIFERAREARGAGDDMTASEIDLLRAQMYRCWRTSLDAPNPEKLKVTIRIRLNPDGTLNAPPEILNAGQIKRSGDPFWQAAADKARRAVLRCEPYTLPADKYASWRDMTMHFTPADILRN